MWMINYIKCSKIPSLTFDSFNDQCMFYSWSVHLLHDTVYFSFPFSLKGHYDDHILLILYIVLQPCYKQVIFYSCSKLSKDFIRPFLWGIKFYDGNYSIFFSWTTWFFFGHDHFFSHLSTSLLSYEFPCRSVVTSWFPKVI